MGFCSESLLLFAAFHPGTSENDCLGDLPMTWMAALGPSKTAFYGFFFGGSTIGVGLGGMKKNPRFTPVDSLLLLLWLGHKPKSGHSSEQNIKNYWFQPLFWVDFHPRKMMRKTHDLWPWWMVDSMCSEMRWVPFFDRKYRRPCDSYRMGQMDTDGGMEVSTLGKLVKLFQIWYIVTYGT